MFLFVLASPANAHTELISTDPVAGATLASTPSAVTLTFTDQMSGEFDVLSLTVASAEPISLEPVAEGNVVRASIPVTKLPMVKEQGPVVWQLTYRVVSADGHPVAGEVTFRAPSPPRDGNPSATNPPGGEGRSGTTPGATPQARDDSEPARPESSDRSSGSSPAVAFVVIGIITVAFTVGFMAFAARRRAQDRADDA